MSQKILSGFLSIDGKLYECSIGEHYKLINEGKISEKSIHLGQHYSDTFSMQESGPIIIEDRTKQKEWYEKNKQKLNEGQKKKLEFIFNFSNISLFT